MFSLPLVNYYNQRPDSVGAHGAYSPILPLDGKLMLDWVKAARAIYERHGLDLSCDYFMHERYAVFVCMLPFDKTDPAQRVTIDKVFHELFDEGTRRGFAKYRTHINHMGVLFSTILSFSPLVHIQQNIHTGLAWLG